MAPIKRKLPSPSPPSPQQLTPHSSPWADEASLLRAAVAFRSATGSLPKIPTMSDFLPFIENPAIATSFSQSELYHKLRHLKQAYISPSPTHPLPDPIHRLSAEIWGGGRKKKPGQAGGKEPVFTASDEVELLRGAIAFRHITGAIPELDTMGEFLPYIKGYFSSDSFDEQVVYDKLGQLQERYSAAGPDGQDLDWHTRLMYELSADVWGGKELRPAKVVDKEVIDIAEVAVDGTDGSQEPERNSCVTKDGELDPVGMKRMRTSNKIWTDSDEVELLRGVIAYRSAKGSTPTVETMGEVFPFVEGKFSVAFTSKQLYDKFVRLRHRYKDTNARVLLPNSHSSLMYELSTEVWGEKVVTPVIRTELRPKTRRSDSNADGIVKTVAAESIESPRAPVIRTEPRSKTCRSDSNADGIVKTVATESIKSPRAPVIRTEPRPKTRISDSNADGIIKTVATESIKSPRAPVIRTEPRPKTRRSDSNADGIVKTVATESIKSPRPFDKKWSNEDEIALLRGAISLRPFSDFIPKRSTMKDLFSHIGGHLGADFTEDRAYTKLRRLREQYFNTDADSLDANSHRRTVYDLCAEVWGCLPERTGAVQFDEETKEDTIRNEVGGGANDSFPFLREAATEYWKANNLSCVYLEKAWKTTDPDKCKRLEEKWRKFNDDLMKCHLMKLDLTRELLAMFMDATST